VVVCQPFFGLLSPSGGDCGSVGLLQAFQQPIRDDSAGLGWQRECNVENGFDFCVHLFLPHLNDFRLDYTALRSKMQPHIRSVEVRQLGTKDLSKNDSAIRSFT